MAKYGRASLRDGDANRLVSRTDAVFLVGGNLKQCLASTYNSIVRAMERQNERIEMVFVEDLVFFQTKKGRKAFLKALRDKGSRKKLEYYFQSYRKSDLVVGNDFVVSKDLR